MPEIHKEYDSRDSQFLQVVDHDDHLEALRYIYFASIFAHKSTPRELENSTKSLEIALNALRDIRSVLNWRTGENKQ